MYMFYGDISANLHEFSFGYKPDDCDMISQFDYEVDLQCAFFCLFCHQLRRGQEAFRRAKPFAQFFNFKSIMQWFMPRA